MSRRAILRICCIALAIVCAPIPAGAGPTAGGLSSRLVMVPGELLQRLSSHPDLTQFIDDLQGLLRDLDRDGNGLNAADVKAAERRAVAEARERQLVDAFSYDLNGDGRVGLAEIRTAVESEDAIAAMVPASHGKATVQTFFAELTEADNVKQVSRLLRLDRNHDDIIAFDEARLLSPETRAAAVKGPMEIVRALLFLDPTHDGQLTGEDMTLLAKIIFGAFDLRADGKLVDAERALLAPYLPVDPKMVRQRPYLPPSADDLRCLLRSTGEPPCPPE